MDCIHYSIITIEDGIKIGRCKKCGYVKNYGSFQERLISELNYTQDLDRFNYYADDTEGSWSNGIRVLDEN